MRLRVRNQDALWKHMAKTCDVRLMSSVEYSERKSLLGSAVEEVNQGWYSPRPIHGFLSAAKGASVARFVPVFTYVDTAIYFACMQHLDRKLAGAAVTNTFGGWRLGTARREIEEQEALAILGGEGCPSMPPSCYNRAAWMKNWQEYWKILAAKYEHADGSAWFAMFDIANFYDSVDLSRLETGVRSICADEPFAINVLFHLLASWNRAQCLYRPSTKGLPMDLVGDGSRLLANFFLTAFDRPYREHVQSRGGDFMRFADDMVVCVSTQQECERFVFEASARLNDLGLNIAVAKVKYCTKAEFERFWGFVIMDRFENNEPDEALSALESVITDDSFGRRLTALKRAITIVDREPRLAGWRRWVHDAVVEADLVSRLSREQLLAFMRLSGDFPASLDEVTTTVVDQPFTLPKAILLRALEGLQRHRIGAVRDIVMSMTQRIAQLNDPVLNLALKHFTN
jgi:hypothetical protein